MCNGTDITTGDAVARGGHDLVARLAGGRGGRDLVARLAGAPISWGVCEVPGWGRMLPPERVFAEMAELGLRATELGPIGYVPYEPAAIRERLDRHGLRLVGGFVPLVLHERDLAPTRAAAERSAKVLAGAGAQLFVAAVVADEAWSAPRPLDDDAWDRLAANLREVERVVAQHGLTLAVHPHAGTQVQNAAEIERLLARSDAGWCLDTGHLVIGGVDPAEFVRRHGDRIVHAHLKDVDERIATRLRDGELSLVEATQAGLFRPLGRGDARIAEVIDVLEASGYEGWLVLEQDTALTGEEPPVGSGPVLDVRESIEYLHTLAPGSDRERVAEP
jgi:inosose dehydratase